METWEPISEEEFSELFTVQYNELNGEQKEFFDANRAHPWKAVIRRSEQMGDEHVYVVAQIMDHVLYFDDVEFGFNWAAIDESGRIINPGGSQNSLQGALIGRFPNLR